MHNPAPVLENDTHKLLWDFNIQTDQLILARRPDHIIINKKKKRREFAVSADKRINLKESEKITESGKWKESERIIKRPGWLGSSRTGRDYPNDSIAKNG